MVRSAAILLTILILPGFALAQQAQGTHTVVDGDTLWDLAQAYYGDPFDWRRIWEANQAQIADPNLIVPGQVIVIPGAPGSEPEPADPAMPESPMVATAPTPEAPQAGAMRTIFYQDTSTAMGVVGLGAVEYLAVPRDLVYSAPRLTGMGGDPAHTGAVTGAAGGRNPTGTVRTFDRIHVSLDRPVRVGDELQIFTVGRTIDGVGRVVHPTGVITISDLVEGGAVGVVTKEFARIEPGQFVGPVPSYELVPGQHPEDMANGDAAMLMGFASASTLPGVGDVAFLDLGAVDGIRLGDEFTVFNPIDVDEPEGRLQVVAVQDETASARILNMTDAVFGQGVVVRLTKKMR